MEFIQNHIPISSHSMEFAHSHISYLSQLDIVIDDYILHYPSITDYLQPLSDAITSNISNKHFLLHLLIIIRDITRNIIVDYNQPANPAHFHLANYILSILSSHDVFKQLSRYTLIDISHKNYFLSTYFVNNLYLSSHDISDIPIKPLMKFVKQTSIPTILSDLPLVEQLKDSFPNFTSSAISPEHAISYVLYKISYILLPEDYIKHN